MPLSPPTPLSSPLRATRSNRTLAEPPPEKPHDNKHFAVEPGDHGKGTISELDDPDLVAQHPAMPEDIERLSAEFSNEAADRAWLRRFDRGELHRHWFDHWILSIPGLVLAMIVTVYVFIECCRS